MVYSEVAEGGCLGDAGTRQQEDIVVKSTGAPLKLNDFKVISVSKSPKGSLTLDVSVCKNT